MYDKYKQTFKKVHLGFRCKHRSGPSDASAAVLLHHTVSIKDSAEGFLSVNPLRVFLFYPIVFIGKSDDWDKAAVFVQRAGGWCEPVQDCSHSSPMNLLVELYTVCKMEYAIGWNV